MKKRLMTALGIEAFLCFILAITLSGYYGGGDSASAAGLIFGFPFIQIGRGLRALSLSGTAGNVIALVIYIGLCISPAVYLAYRYRKGRARIEDSLLALLSFLLILVIYYIINPAEMLDLFSAPAPLSFDYGGVFLSVLLYSVIIGYAVLRALRGFSKNEAAPLLKSLNILVAVYCAFLVFVVFYQGVFTLAATLKLYGGGVPGGSAALSGFFIVLQSIVIHVPHAFQILILLSATDLISALRVSAYSDETLTSAEKMAQICRISVVTIMLSHIGLNLLQFIFGAGVANVNYGVSLSLESIIFVLVGLLLAKHFAQNKELKEDNDMII